MINVPLLRKTLEHITAHPEEWSQDSWGMQVFTPSNVCQTSHCLAGHAVVLTGHKILWSGVVTALDHGDVEHASFTLGGKSIRDVARDELGLTGAQAATLFDGMNSLYKLWALARHWTDGEIEIPEDVYST